MNKTQEQLTPADVLIRGGQVFSEGIRRVEPSIISALKMFEPMTVLANLSKPWVMAKGSQVKKRLTVQKKPRKIGRNAHTFDNLFPYSLQTSSDVPPRIERNTPKPVLQKPREVRGPGARMAKAAIRGGELYSRTGEGQITSKHRKVYTSIF